MSETGQDLKLRANDERTTLRVGSETFETIPALLAAHPRFAEAAAAAALARGANHLLRGGGTYEVILDPAAYAEWFRTRLATEDPGLAFAEGVPRLGDYGVPDFDAILAPAIAGGTLVFFARDRLTGLPYSATVELGSGEARYRPVPLTPIARPAEMRVAPPPEAEGIDDPDALPEGEDAEDDGTEALSVLDEADAPAEGDDGTDPQSP